MADEMNHGWGLSPYETFMVNEKTSRRPSGVAVTGLVLGSVAAALGIGAWIFAPIFSRLRSDGNFSTGIPTTDKMSSISEYNFITCGLLSPENFICILD